MKRTKEIFKDTVKQYFAPLNVLVDFSAIFVEFWKQMYLSIMTPSEEFQAIQDQKFEVEVSKPILEEEE